MGRAYRIQEKWSEAQAALERAVELKSDTAQYHYVLSIVYRKLGKQAESGRHLRPFASLTEVCRAEAQNPAAELCRRIRRGGVRTAPKGSEPGWAQSGTGGMIDVMVL
jgi:hypothetical protein